MSDQEVEHNAPDGSRRPRNAEHGKAESLAGNEVVSKPKKKEVAGAISKKTAGNVSKCMAVAKHRNRQLYLGMIRARVGGLELRRMSSGPKPKGNPHRAQ